MKLKDINKRIKELEPQLEWINNLMAKENNEHIYSMLAQVRLSFTYEYCLLRIEKISRGLNERKK